jgi:hypothetical protein
MGLFKSALIAVFLLTLLSSCAKKIVPGFYITRHQSNGSGKEYYYRYLELKADSSFTHEIFFVKFIAEDIGPSTRAGLSIGRYHVDKKNIELEVNRKITLEELQHSNLNPIFFDPSFKIEKDNSSHLIPKRTLIGPITKEQTLRAIKSDSYDYGKLQ